LYAYIHLVGIIETFFLVLMLSKFFVNNESSNHRRFMALRISRLIYSNLFKDLGFLLYSLYISACNVGKNDGKKNAKEACGSAMKIVKNE